MKSLDGIGLFSLLVIRGLALWVVIPISFLSWTICHSWAQKASFRQVLCWYDRNVISLFAKSVLRPLLLAEHRPRFIGLSDMNQIVPYRITLADFT